MRLDDFDPNINVEDQRGSGGGGFGGGGGGGLLFGLLPLIGSRFGCGGIVVVLLLMAVFGGLGNLGGLVGGGGGAPVSSSRPHGTDVRSSCDLNAESKTACNAFSSADHTWAALFQQQGKAFQQPKLVFYDRNGQSGCGAAQSAMGPFYCPTDQGIYLDTSFFNELSTRFQAGGDFAQDYVVAHEFGHHIQNLLGVSDKVATAQRSGSQTEGQPCLGAAGAAGGLLCRRLGGAEPRGAGSGRCRGRPARRAPDRRRHAAAGKPGPRRPRQLHPRHVRRADEVAQAWPRQRRPGAVRYVQRWGGWVTAPGAHRSLPPS